MQLARLQVQQPIAFPQNDRYKAEGFIVYSLFVIQSSKYENTWSKSYKVIIFLLLHLAHFKVKCCCCFFFSLIVCVAVRI